METAILLIFEISITRNKKFSIIFLFLLFIIFPSTYIIFFYIENSKDKDYVERNMMEDN